jgi:hypothetical protein
MKSLCVKLALSFLADDDCASKKTGLEEAQVMEVMVN